MTIECGSLIALYSQKTKNPRAIRLDGTKNSPGLSTATLGLGVPSISLWGVPFLLFGLYGFAGRFMVDAWARRGISYAVTDKRILIQRAAPFAKFTAMPFDLLPPMDLIERGSGCGTIRFDQDRQTVSNWGFAGHGGWLPAFDPTPQFIAIEDARRVFEQIQMHLAKRD